MTIIAVGAYLYGALYLIGVFTMGLVTGCRYAALTAIGAAGLSYLAQLLFARGLDAPVSPALQNTVWAAAVIAAVTAGVLLIVGA